MINLSRLFSKKYKKIAIVGKGAVGSAIMKSLDDLEIDYDAYDSSNIEEIFKDCYDLMIYSGVNASKYYADRNQIEDKLHCLRAFDIFKNICSDQKILISTIDASSAFDQSSAYGINRAMLESKILKDEELSNKSKILRLPALYGSTVKKNAWYDSIRGADSINLNEDLVNKIVLECKNLKSTVNQSDYNILSFVNPRSDFAWYHLDTILHTIARVIELDESLHQVVSYDDVYKSGILLTHQELTDRFGYEVEFIRDSKILEYHKALFDREVYLMFEKSSKSIFDESWKEILK